MNRKMGVKYLNKIQWPHRSRSGEEKPEPPKPQVPAIETDPAAGLTTAPVEER